VDQKAERMDQDDKRDFIAAILASGSSGNDGAPA
jgi:hypothetical protein